MAPPPCAARWIVLLAQGDPPHTNDSTTTQDLADDAVLRQADRQPINESDQTRAELTVTPTNQQLVDHESV